jgi:urease subunit alpha
MTVLNHGLSWDVPGDVQLVRERILEARTAAEGLLHELGAIQIVNSDSQGMGRIGETVRRTFQLAHVMKAWRRSEAASGVEGLPPDPGLGDPDDRDDTERVLRYLAKVTIEPAITHGVSAHVGSLLPGRLADIVLWSPGFFAVKPDWVFKGGFPAWGPMGEGNASLEWAEPTRYRPDWAGLAGAAPRAAVTFVAPGVDRAALARRLGTRRTLVPVANLRGLTRASLHANTAAPQVDIDVLTGAVSLAGRHLAVDPVTEVPLSRRFLLR